MAKDIDVSMAKYSINYNPETKKWILVGLFTASIHKFDTTKELAGQVQADLEDTFGESVF